MIKKAFIIFVLNGAILSLQAMEQAAQESMIDHLSKAMMEKYVIDTFIRPEAEKKISFLHALQNGKLSLQKEKRSYCENYIEKEEIVYLVPDFKDTSKIYEFSLDETAESLCSK